MSLLLTGFLGLLQFKAQPGFQFQCDSAFWLLLSVAVAAVAVAAVAVAVAVAATGVVVVVVVSS